MSSSEHRRQHTSEQHGDIDCTSTAVTEALKTRRLEFSVRLSSSQCGTLVQNQEGICSRSELNQKVLNFAPVEVPVAANSSSRVLRFSTFEVNLHTRELRQRGQKIRLQEQPLQLLAALLERPGELVTREELRNKLWPADTFVDFDHSLNAAIKRLRDALGESAERPIFIETLARRGYRPAILGSAPSTSFVMWANPPNPAPHTPSACGRA